MPKARNLGGMDDKPIRREQQVFSITSASTSQSEEIGKRQKRYAISMGIRTLCFILACVFWNHILWLAVVFIAGALFLPYTSVILANAGVRRKGAGPSPFLNPPRSALPGSASSDPDPHE